MAACRPLTEGEVERVRAAMQGCARDACLVEMGLAGLRVGEALSLRVGDVWDLVHREPRRLTAIRGEKGDTGHLIIPARARAAIFRYVAERWPEATVDGIAPDLVGSQIPPGPPADAPLILSREGGGKPLAYHQARRIITHAFRDAGITDGKASTHSLRKTWATVLLRAGWSYDKIAAAGRWRKADTVAAYARHDINDLARDMEALEPDAPGEPVVGRSLVGSHLGQGPREIVVPRATSRNCSQPVTVD